MAALSAKGLRKAYMVLAAVAFTLTSLPSAAAKESPSADKLPSGIRVPNIPKIYNKCADAPQHKAPEHTPAGNRKSVEQTIRKGDHNEIALAIHGQLTGHGPDANKSVVYVYYMPVLTHNVADKVCQLIWGARKEAQADFGRLPPVKQDFIIYGAVAGLELSKDPADVKQLLDKCKRHGLSIWTPSGCWQEGRKDAASLDLQV